MPRGGKHSSREMIVQARERERQVVQLFIRGLTWLEIARQLGYGEESGARKAFARAVKRIPPKDVEVLRKLQSERMTDSRRRIYSELAGREMEIPDPENPGQKKRITVRPEVSDVGALLGRLLNVEQHEADLYGLYAPKKSDVVAHFTGQPMSDEQLDEGLARLTEQEREQFMMLLAKLEGRWVEPPPPSVETTAVPHIEPPRNANGSGENNG
jgi:hypothetical protein